MRELVRQRQSLTDMCQGLLRVPQQPESPSGKGSAGNTRIVANAEHHRTALVWRVAGDAFLQVLAGSRQRAKPEPRHPEGIVGDDRERRVGGVLRQAQQGSPELLRRLELWPCNIKPPQPKQDR